MVTQRKMETFEQPTTGSELVTTDGRSLPMTGATLRGDARGGIARMVLEQRFENPHAETLAVTYRMPLPADGAVAGYEFEIDGRVIRGQVDKKHRARERFEQAVASGHTAALLEQDRADIFTQQIGNLPPRSALVARITVDHKLAWLREGEWELRFPTVIGPRYLGTTETAQDARETSVAVATDGISSRIAIEVNVGDAVTGSISSPTHVLSQANGRVTLRAGAKLDRDIVMRWPVAAREVGAAISIARPAQDHADAYGLLSLVPPAPDAKFEALPRDLIILLDTSGSMGGAPLTTAKRVLGLLIDDLRETDRLELIEFSSTARRWKSESVHATSATRAAAKKWLDGRSAGGSTEMHGAVLEALRAMRPDAQRQVVLVTDGYIGGEEQIVRLLVEGLPMSSRLHVVGVGSAANRALALAMARAGRGAEILVGPDEDVERATKRLADRTNAPVVTDVELSGSALLDCAPSRLPDVFAGAPIVAAVRLSASGGELVVTGKLARGTYKHVVRVPATSAGAGNQGIAALYARERVADLEARASYGSGEPIETEIESIGLTFQIATRKTSWVAIDESRVVKGEGSRHEVMPQEVPYGTSAASFGLRPAGGEVFPHALAFDDSEDLELGMATGAGMAAPKGAPMAGYAPQMQMPAPSMAYPQEKSSMRRHTTRSGMAAPSQMQVAPMKRSAKYRLRALVVMLVALGVVGAGLYFLLRWLLG